MIQSHPTMANYNVDSEQIGSLVHDLQSVVMHPAFQENVAKCQSLPLDQRPQGFQQLFSLDALQAKGIPIPDSLRTSPRIFDEQGAITSNNVAGQPVRVAASPAATNQDQLSENIFATSVCVSGGLYVCISVGKQY